MDYEIWPSQSPVESYMLYMLLYCTYVRDRCVVCHTMCLSISPVGLESRQGLNPAGINTPSQTHDVSI